MRKYKALNYQDISSMNKGNWFRVFSEGNTSLLYTKSGDICTEANQPKGDVHNL